MKTVLKITSGEKAGSLTENRGEYFLDGKPVSLLAAYRWLVQVSNDYELGISQNGRRVKEVFNRVEAHAVKGGAE